MNVAKCGKSKLWLPFSDESSLGDARLHRILIAGVKDIPKRWFVSAFPEFSWFPEHEKLLAKPRTNKHLAQVRAVQLAWAKKSLLSPWAFNRTAAWMFKAKSSFSAKFSAARAGPWLLALDMGWCHCQCKFESLLFDWKLRRSFVVSRFRSLHGWYVVALRRFMHGSNCTWARSGETEFAISRVTTSLYLEFEPKANRNEVFHRNFEYSPSRCFSFFYLQAASQTHAFDAGDTMWRPSSSWVDHKQTARSLRLFLLRRKSMRTQAQLHTLGVEVDLNLAAAVFPNRTRLSLRSQQAARGRPQIMCDRRHGNWSSSCLEVPRLMSRSPVADPGFESRGGVEF